MTDFAPHNQWLVNTEYIDYIFVSHEGMKKQIVSDTKNISDFDVVYPSADGAMVQSNIIESENIATLIADTQNTQLIPGVSIKEDGEMEYEKGIHYYWVNIRNNIDGNEEDTYVYLGFSIPYTIFDLNFETKDSETSPPSRYNSGSIILAMENAGKLIEDEELREQIKGAGIGTSATRAEIMKKLEKIKYIEINTKTQIITPTNFGEIIYDVVNSSMPDMLNPKLTASWEKGLDMVAKKEIQPNEFMRKIRKIYSF